MIKEFTAQGYGCLSGTTVRDLTPLHAFIGPNDSGKSTLLKAVRALCIAASRTEGLARTPLVSDALVQAAPRTNRPLSLRASIASGEQYNVSWSRNWWESRVHGTSHQNGDTDEASLLLRQRQPGIDDPLLLALSGVRMVRLRPEDLRQATPLLDGDLLLEFRNERGLGLGAVLDAVRDRNEDAWRALLEDVRAHFPNVRRLQLQVHGDGKTVAAELLDGTRVGVDELSEGFLYYLAFAAMRHLDPVAILCVEEPENGLHPARIREVMGILRAISAAGTQVLLTTHSPLLVNELLPTEVTVLTRPKDGGTVATRMADIPLYRERIERDALMPGEFWASYCDGKFEEPMLKPTPLES